MSSAVLAGKGTFSCHHVAWPNFCGGRVLQTFRFAPNNYDVLWRHGVTCFTGKRAERNAAKAIVEYELQGCGSLAIADRAGGPGSTYLINALPRYWYSKDGRWKYTVSKSPVYKNPVHNSDVHHCTVYKLAAQPKPKKPVATEERANASKD